MSLTKRVERLLRSLHSRRFKESLDLGAWTCRRAYYAEEGQYQWGEGTEEVFPGYLESKPGETLFMECRLSVPQEWRKERFGLVFQAGGEGLLSINGQSYHGLDKNRSFIPFANDLAGTELQASVELYHVPPLQEDFLNGQTDAVTPPVHFQEARLVTVNAPVESLYFTVTVCWEAVQRLPSHHLERIRMEACLEEAAQALTEHTLGDEGLVSRIEEALRLVWKGTEALGLMHMVGQSHIDLAWLWPLKETVRKASRTFSTVCTLMDHYPGYRYTQSQPQLYAYVKEHNPQLYERIKARIAEGRWELVGGMWVEPDLNIPSGESLVRQLLYGRAFYREEFGRTPRVEWLPDTFGYCASLPQLLKKSGVDYFMTSKMNWNDTNPFPYDLFYWVGIDGSSVLSFLNHGLNENTLASDVSEHWESYRQKSAHPEQMLLYGFGDGGGGVTREMLEYAERSVQLPGLPSCRFGTAHDFFRRVEEAGSSLPKWTGDMYLELHRGTYTTHGRNKRFNRKAEVLYREAEIWNALSALAGGEDQALAAERRQEELDNGWRILLLNQFHDIIPGTSITEVYRKSEEQYGQVFSRGEQALQSGLGELAARICTEGEGMPVVLFNSLSWDRTDPVEIQGGRELEAMAVYDGNGEELKSDVLASADNVCTLYVQAGSIPALGYKTVWLRAREEKAVRPETGDSLSLAGRSWETERCRLIFDQRGRITSWFNKADNREIIEPGQTGNHLQLFHDRPAVWDAWDIDPRFDSQPAGEAELVAARVAYQGSVMDILHMEWLLGSSRVEQDIVLYHHSDRVDFRTKADWREAHKLLKVAFPVEILSARATYEIPFGSIERPTHANTSWERAQFEVCGHRWADLSEGGYGVSLLNDCKYGYDIKGNVMRLSLLRSPRWPDATSDVGVHEFVYSVFPHAGDWRSAGTVRQGYELNHPVRIHFPSAHEGRLPFAGSFVKVEARHAVLDTLKLAMDKSGVVLRLYESSGGREEAAVGFMLRGGQGESNEGKLVETNLMEEPSGAELPLNGGAAAFAVRPYEVVTFKLPVGSE